ncbi:MAG: DUF3598 family protein [Scytonema sp. RU_4_4]|nr:DUF3598 family protein [Scytonema sp. RU_4_4]NJR74368.1 DUF3598 family protein [Scytonema sp. CRU_2_7]
MDLKEQNWKNFTTNHLRDWHGIWTRYSPEGEVTESFQSLRSFRSHPEETEITHTNYSVYADGRRLEQSWEYNQLSNSLSDGVFHPQTESMRGIFFESGHAAWVSTKLKTGSYFGVELFFKYEELRHSVGIVYDESGSLFRIANIREDATGFPSQYWSNELNQLSLRDLSGHWQGTAVTMTPDLKISAPVATHLHWGWKEHKTFFLPDGVSISCPKKVSIGTSFTMAVNWLVKTSEMQQLLVKYDNSGDFSMLTLELLYV